MANIDAELALLRDAVDGDGKVSREAICSALRAINDDISCPPKSVTFPGEGEYIAEEGETWTNVKILGDGEYTYVDKYVEGLQVTENGFYYTSDLFPGMHTVVLTSFYVDVEEFTNGILLDLDVQSNGTYDIINEDDTPAYSTNSGYKLVDVRVPGGVRQGDYVTSSFYFVTQNQAPNSAARIFLYKDEHVLLGSDAAAFIRRFPPFLPRGYYQVVGWNPDPSKIQNGQEYTPVWTNMGHNVEYLHKKYFSLDTEVFMYLNTQTVALDLFFVAGESIIELNDHVAYTDPVSGDEYHPFFKYLGHGDVRPDGKRFEYVEWGTNFERLDTDDHVRERPIYNDIYPGDGTVYPSLDINGFDPNYSLYFPANYDPISRTLIPGYTIEEGLDSYTLGNLPRIPYKDSDTVANAITFYNHECYWWKTSLARAIFTGDSSNLVSQHDLDIFALFGSNFVQNYFPSDMYDALINIPHYVNHVVEVDSSDTYYTYRTVTTDLEYKKGSGWNPQVAYEDAPDNPKEAGLFEVYFKRAIDPSDNQTYYSKFDEITWRRTNDTTKQQSDDKNQIIRGQWVREFVLRYYDRSITNHALLADNIKPTYENVTDGIGTGWTDSNRKIKHSSFLYVYEENGSYIPYKKVGNDLVRYTAYEDERYRYFHTPPKRNYYWMGFYKDLPDILTQIENEEHITTVWCFRPDLAWYRWIGNTCFFLFKYYLQENDYRYLTTLMYSTGDTYSIAQCEEMRIRTNSYNVHHYTSLNNEYEELIANGTCKPFQGYKLATSHINDGDICIGERYMTDFVRSEAGSYYDGDDAAYMRTSSDTYDLMQTGFYNILEFNDNNEVKPAYYYYGNNVRKQNYDTTQFPLYTYTNPVKYKEDLVNDKIMLIGDRNNFRSEETYPYFYLKNYNGIPMFDFSTYYDYEVFTDPTITNVLAKEEIKPNAINASDTAISNNYYLTQTTDRDYAYSKIPDALPDVDDRYPFYDAPEYKYPDDISEAHNTLYTYYTGTPYANYMASVSGENAKLYYPDYIYDDDEICAFFRL